MLKLEHFIHLPELDPLIERLVAEGPGLIVVAGLDPHATYAGGGGGSPKSAWATSLVDPKPAPTRNVGPATSEGFLPSGRTTIFRILMREMLAQRPGRAIVVAEDEQVVRIPRSLAMRIELSLVQPGDTYARHIASAVDRRPALLVIDRLCAESASLALETAQRGFRVLSQIDTVFRGADVARHLVDLGVPPKLLGSLTWVVFVQRVPTLCPRCKRPVSPDPAQLDELYRRYPNLDNLARDGDQAQAEAFCHAPGCADCHYTGRRGDVACFDVFRADAAQTSLGSGSFGQPSLLSLQEYVLRLALLGYLSLEDVLHFERDQLRRTYNLFADSERALAGANAALRRKLIELETANRVLQQRTEALISLQDIGQALIAAGHESATSLRELAIRVCRHTRDLCGADRAILCLVRPGNKVEVLAVMGWDAALVHQQLDAALVLPALEDASTMRAEPVPFTRRPPGVSPEEAQGVPLGAGLLVPLVAQQEQVGLMIVHTTQRECFTPGEVALLQTYANQAALAIQRAGLIEELRAKIVQLEAAQAELVQKERMERELELARQVQQSVLPRTFPQVPGYAFAAHNEPARQVGGDFYDVIRLDAGHFGVAIADVSDKGMPAAVYMALTRSLLLAEARRDRSPRAVLDNVNRLLLELGEPGMFVSVFYGVVEAATRQLTYARAGHDRPLLLRGGTVLPLGGRGAVLGILGQDNLNLSEEQIVLAPGDRLVLYTDGLTDVLAPDDQLFSLERLKSLLQSCAAKCPDELCATTFAGLATYRGDTEQFDDMTMLVVQVES